MSIDSPISSAKCISSVIAIGTVLCAAGASAQDLRTRPQVRPVIRPPVQLEVVPTEVVPPADVESVEIPQAVTLQPGPSSSMIGQLQVQRTLDVASLRRNPLLQVGTVQADMRPVLQNPAAPMNVASRILSLHVRSFAILILNFLDRLLHLLLYQCIHMRQQNLGLQFANPLLQSSDSTSQVMNWILRHGTQH